MIWLVFPSSPPEKLPAEGMATTLIRNTAEPRMMDLLAHRIPVSMSTSNRVISPSRTSISFG